MLLEGQEIGLRVGGQFFEEYGGDMKAWNNDHNPHRWVKQMNKRRMPYLRAYAPPRPEAYEGKVIQGKGSKELFLVKAAHRRAFPDFTTFLKMGFTIENVQLVSQEVLHVIPVGDVLVAIK